MALVAAILQAVQAVNSIHKAALLLGWEQFRQVHTILGERLSFLADLANERAKQTRAVMLFSVVLAVVVLKVLQTQLGAQAFLEATVVVALILAPLMTDRLQAEEVVLAPTTAMQDQAVLGNAGGWFSEPLVLEFFY